MSYFKASLLPPEIAKSYEIVDAESEECWKRGDTAGLEACYSRLWQLLPEPKFIWSESTSLAIRVAFHFLKTNQIAKALDWVPNLIGLFETTSSTYSVVIAGRIYLEAGQRSEAIKWFKKVYEIAGTSGFRGDNRQFLDLIEKAPRKKVTKPKAKEWPKVPDPDAYKLMAGPVALDDDVHESVETLCGEGDTLAEAGQYDAAISKYREALFLLPRPIEKWDASTWIYVAIGDAMFLKGDFLSAAIPLRDVMYCPDAQTNPFIRLRRGQVAFEKGNLPVAEKELAEAYRLEGEKIFADEDQKYWAFIKARLKP